MKNLHKILLGLLLFWIGGYILFIWGRLPGQYDPTQLGGKGLPTGNQFVCGWNWRSPLLLECDAGKFFSDSIRVYGFLTIYLPLALVAGFLFLPFLLISERFFWPISILLWLVILGLAYLLYRRYKKKRSSEQSPHDPSLSQNQK